jgi:hypothetical protein
VKIKDKNRMQGTHSSKKIQALTFTKANEGA